MPATNGSWNADADTYAFTAETSPPWLGGIPATDGGIVTLLTAHPPLTPAAAGSFDFLISVGISADLDLWLNPYYAFMHNITVDHPDAVVTLTDFYNGFEGPTGDLTILRGKAIQRSATGVWGTVTVASGAIWQVEGESYALGAVAIDGTLLVTAGNFMILGVATTPPVGETVLTGTVDCSAAGAWFDSANRHGLTGDGGTIKLSSTSRYQGLLNLTTCTWIVAAGAYANHDWAGANNYGGPTPNLDVIFDYTINHEWGTTGSLTDAVVRDITVTDGTITLTNLSCRVLTLAAAKTLTLAGVVQLSGNPVLNAGTLNLGHSAILASGRTIDGVSLAALTSSGAIIQGGASVVTINNMTGSVGTIFARRWTGTGNGTKVQTLAPHWLLGLR